MPSVPDADALLERLESLHRIGVALSSERDIDALLEKILGHARALTHADAGTIYVVEPEGDTLRFAVLHNESLDLRQGGATGGPIDLELLPLHLADGSPNHGMVAAHVALEGVPITIDDAYEAESFDFSGTKAFDRRTGYRSMSFLTVPMKDHEENVVGVLQLINATDPRTSEIVPFTPDHERAVLSLASQAAVALDNRQEAEAAMSLAARLERLAETGVALSAEKDISVLLERILLDAKWLTNADGGTLYMMTPDERALAFEIMRNDSLGTAKGGTTGEPVGFDPLPLYKADGSPNHETVAAHVALTGEAVSIPDAYEAEGFDFSGTKRFDAKTGYRSRSFLTVPLKDHEDELLGVLQLINARTGTGRPMPFSEERQQLVESLASQAAVALTNRKLIQGLRDLFDAIIKSLATAIDRKSPYTGGHCERVPVLTLLIAAGACEESEGPLAKFSMNDDERYELAVAAWLHDCGKVATPEHVVDKSTKLETIHDRVEEVKTRFEVLERDAEIAWLRARLDALDGDPDAMAEDPAFQADLKSLREERAFLERANVGGEFMRGEDQERVRAIATRRWRGPDGEERALLSENEIENLNVERGTLTPAERQIINDHVVVSIEMLEQLPYPKNLRHVPEFAGGHHEKIDGTGYPKGLTREQMSWEARMMAVADIFEALTAPDRPYRTPNPLSKALFILGKMKEEQHIDPDLFDLFVRRKIYLKYAQEHLSPEQIDEIDESRIPGYEP